MDIDSYITKHYGSKPNRQFAEEVNKKFGTQYNAHSLHCKHFRLRQGDNMPRKPASVERDIETSHAKSAQKYEKNRYKLALKKIDELQEQLSVVKVIEEVSTHEIHPQKPSGTSESVAVVLASDWHVEETVDKKTVNNLNEFNLVVAKERADRFFASTLRLIQILQKDTRIDTLVLGLLGDFITGNIHEDLSENRGVGTASAILFSQNLICSGIDFLLEHSKLHLTIPCHSGNHGRATKEQRIATENENSHEYLMYHTIAGRYEGNKRVNFIISPSYYSYVNIYGINVRFHHGHFFKYGGGIGGLFVPVRRGIAQSNVGKPKELISDLDCFGHFHQAVDGGNFICNGSLIGYNPFATYVKAGYDKPKQMMFLVEKKRGRTFTIPVYI